MYHILLLHKLKESNCRVKDYLQLSGYKVMEEELECSGELELWLGQSDLIVVECDELQGCYVGVQALRKQTQLPIVVLSEHNDEWEKIRLFQSGIDDYLVKPYWQGELLARIQAHIERYRNLTRPIGIIELGELRINAFNRKVYLGDVEVEMRLKEFDVLLYLAQNVNEVVRKEEIYAAVWKDNLADSFYSSVTVHIKRIREKIEENVDSPQYIETVWGVGYRLNYNPLVRIKP